MKVVINKCYGGFSLSHQGVMEYARLKGIQLYAYEHDYKDGKPKYKPYVEGGKVPMVIHYTTKPIPPGGTYEKGSYFSGYDMERNDPDLVQVVETLGKAANGMCADLAIVEIPDNVDWEIDEYDGSEHIAEKHRTWY